jgi:hypothetical protein
MRDGGSKWSFDIETVSRNTFAGGFDERGKIVEGKIEGNIISLATHMRVSCARYLSPGAERHAGQEDRASTLKNQGKKQCIEH